MTDPVAARSRRLTLEALRRAQAAAYRRPRDAAALILIDRSSPVPKVLLGRRHAGHAFMPGVFVFPGGAVDPGDRRMTAHGSLDIDCGRRLLSQVVRPTLTRARALALAAIRETFEETGLLIAAPAKGPLKAPSAHWTAFTDRGLVPSLSPLRFVARAVTPPGRPRRFDTRFFVADASAVTDRVDGVIGPDAELVELAWVPLDATRDLKIPMITQIILEEVADQVTAGFPAEMPVPFYRLRHNVFGRVALS